MELLALLLPDPDQLFSQGEPLLSPWQGPASDKVRIAINGKNYFFKRYNCRGSLYGIKNLFRRSRAFKSWLASFHFSQAGVPTPEPLLCLEERCFGLLGRSYLLFPFIAGDAGSFLNLWPALDDNERRGALVSLGALFGGMHRQGLLHGDLNWRNILAEKSVDGYRFSIVDLDGSHTVRKLDLAKAKEDLSHFLRDMDRNFVAAALQEEFLTVWGRVATAT
jgi:tRNA A-37 threonylcarbamoyl transferase component Bud32